MVTLRTIGYYNTMLINPDVFVLLFAVFAFPLGYPCILPVAVLHILHSRL